MAATPVPFSTRVFFLLALAALAACQPSDRAQTHMRIATRLIAEEPRQLFTPEAVHTVSQGFSWSFADPGEVRAWRDSKHGAVPLAAGADALAVEWNEKTVPWLIRRVDFEADSIDAIEIVVAGLRQGHIRIFWAGPSQLFDPARSLTLRALDHEPGRSETYLFELTSHPLWNGNITRFRIDPTLIRGQNVQVKTVHGLKYSIEPERLREAAERPWKVDLDHELRNALLSEPGGTPRVWQVEIPAGGCLRFAYGTSPTTGVAVRFTIHADDGKRVEQLFEETVPTSRSGQWHEARLDLSVWAGPQIVLSLVTESPNSRIPALSFWSEPTILAPTMDPVPPNVVLIVLDTLRADRLSLYGHGRETSPNIDSWARRNAVTFRHAVAPAPWTLPSHISLFTGLDAVGHGLNYTASALPADRTLAEILRHAGYATMAITGGVYLHPRYGFHQGFETFRYWPSSEPQSRELEQGVATVREWLLNFRDRPFFLFFHTYETHSPFAARQPFLDSFLPADPFIGLETRLETRRVESNQRARRPVSMEFRLKRPGPSGGTEPLPSSALPTLNALYDSGVAYADTKIGELLGELDRLGLCRDTIVVLTSDHGEALGEKGLAAHAYLYDFNLLVPLVVAWPDGRGAGRMIDRQVRSVDILPTLLEAAGLEAPGPVDGTSLRALLGDESEGSFPRVAWSYAGSTNTGIALRFANRWKYIYNNSVLDGLHGTDELYDLTADPEETVDVDHPWRAEQLRKLVFQHYELHFKGLRIGLANGGTAPYHLDLRASEDLPASQIKALDLPGDVVSRDGKRGLRITVPAGERFDLFLESITAAKLSLTARLRDRPEPCRLEVDLLRLATPLGLDLSAGDCRRLDVLATVGFTLRMTQGLAAADPIPPRIDPELQRKLEALGYVD